MAHFRVRSRLTRIAAVAGAATAAQLLLVQLPTAQADAVAYLVNVTVRPGYDFPDADTALRYGRSLCEEVGRGRVYTELITDIQTDFHTADPYQGAYLINQAVNELCPALIWQLRRAATHNEGSPSP
jgi:hypothetical protein